ncbi:hypothetical protein JCM10450v2_003330 [Rhodotorula kratochvilovae]
MSTGRAAAEGFTEYAVASWPPLAPIQVPSNKYSTLWTIVIFGRLAALVLYLRLLILAWQQNGLASALAVFKDSIVEVYSDVPKRIFGPHFARQQVLNDALAHLHALGQASVESDNLVTSASTAYGAYVAKPSEDSLGPLEPLLFSLALAQLDYLDMAGLDVAIKVARVESITDDLERLASTLKIQLDSGLTDMASTHHIMLTHALLENLFNRIRTFSVTLEPAASRYIIHKSAIPTLAVARSPFISGVAAARNALAVAGLGAFSANASHAVGPTIAPLLKQVETLWQAATPQFNPERIVHAMALSLNLVEAEVTRTAPRRRSRTLFSTYCVFDSLRSFYRRSILPSCLLPLVGFVLAAVIRLLALALCIQFAVSGHRFNLPIDRSWELGMFLLARIPPQPELPRRGPALSTPRGWADTTVQDILIASKAAQRARREWTIDSTVALELAAVNIADPEARRLHDALHSLRHSEERILRRCPLAVLQSIARRIEVRPPSARTPSSTAERACAVTEQLWLEMAEQLAPFRGLTPALARSLLVDGPFLSIIADAYDPLRTGTYGALPQLDDALAQQRDLFLSASTPQHAVVREADGLFSQLARHIDAAVSAATAFAAAHAGQTPTRVLRFRKLLLTVAAREQYLLDCEEILADEVLRGVLAWREARMGSGRRTGG